MSMKMPLANNTSPAAMKLPPTRTRATKQGKSSAIAANIQQQLEELILEKKEKEALAKIERDEKERRTRWQSGLTVASQAV